VNHSLAERWAAHVARQPTTRWGIFISLAVLTVYLLFHRWSEGNLTVLEVFLYLALSAFIVYAAIVFEGFRRLLAAKNKEVEKFKSPTTGTENDQVAER
jgi:hypothetical protein